MAKPLVNPWDEAICWRLGIIPTDDVLAVAAAWRVEVDGKSDDATVLREWGRFRNCPEIWRWWASTCSLGAASFAAALWFPLVVTGRAWSHFVMRSGSAQRAIRAYHDGLCGACRSPINNVEAERCHECGAPWPGVLPGTPARLEADRLTLYQRLRDHAASGVTAANPSASDGA
ncbi:MAG TPA: hypothetical protein VD971_12985 [Phycisphaerales bacterium]|nr:hypothetical protein [Phycisphaerales bacterium]